MLYYPRQKPDDVPSPYPYAIAMRGKNPAVLDVELLNPYCSAPFGLLITNGEFVSFHGPDPTMVEVEKGHTGSVRFVNCAFWGPCRQIAKIAGRGTVGFSDCTFVQWDSKGEGRHAVQAASGSLGAACRNNSTY